MDHFPIDSVLIFMNDLLKGSVLVLGKFPRCTLFSKAVCMDFPNKYMWFPIIAIDYTTQIQQNMKRDLNISVNDDKVIINVHVSLD